MRRDLGDFQTPPELAAALVRRMGPIGSRWPRVLEPTCGRGAFLEAVLSAPDPPREVVGVEIQASHGAEARARLADRPAIHRASILHADLFELDLRVDLPWIEHGPLLVVGNPPWITSAELGRLGSDNLPPKRNVKGLSGLDARTGAANFDLGEAVWLKLIDELADQTPTIALLCKTSVARAVLQHLHRTGRRVADAELIEIDARRWFSASVGACFLKLSLGVGETTGRVAVFDAIEATRPRRTMGSLQSVFASDLDALEALDFAFGRSLLCWRQGVKHDAAPVMELIGTADGTFRNGLGEEPLVEPSFLYPLVKGADLIHPARERPRRALIVTQEKLGAETRDLADRAPRLWAYLQARAAWFDKRRSSIYKAAPPFALFGIGPYTFAPYKAAVAGLHRPSRFRAVGPVDGRPTVFDDTCYILPCQSALEAAVLTAACNDPITREVLRALTFADAKRPVTKAVLQTIDLGGVLERTDASALVDRVDEVLRDDLGLEGETGDAIKAEVERLISLLSLADGGKLGRTASPDRPA
ncbi:hypothetical protein [Paludisphaera borealis]|uniref:Uncharacterized protein n=1 Tax=Paludisphaera borealis TaxID=1387353 RepID=A0A1U7CPP7_9BACT|nr:hypothetical protein [Paludisphaera borealis]APW60853.1 hypothetical protein BSF38_02345 [Paludisphaera borealis]